MDDEHVRLDNARFLVRRYSSSTGRVYLDAWRRFDPQRDPDTGTGFLREKDGSWWRGIPSDAQKSLIARAFPEVRLQGWSAAFSAWIEAKRTGAG